MAGYIDHIDDILGQNDLPTEELAIPEWGGKVVRLRTLTAAERDEFESSQVQINKKGRPEQNLRNLRARLVSMVLVDSSGAKLVTNRQVVELLGGKSAKAMDRIYSKALEMNGLDEDDVEKLTEDFGTGQVEDSSSD
jgi:hypothetical protein